MKFDLDLSSSCFGTPGQEEQIHAIQSTRAKLVLSAKVAPQSCHANCICNYDKCLQLAATSPFPIALLKPFQGTSSWAPGGDDLSFLFSFEVEVNASSKDAS